MASDLLENQPTSRVIKAFTFDPVAHRYYLNGAEIPGVTRILGVSGLRPLYDGFHTAQQRGLHVHDACERLDLEDLDWDSICPAWRGYVEAYARFKEEHGFVPEYVEYQTYHAEFRFAGTVDRRGRLHGEPIILDLKTGAEEHWHRWQTAGYAILGRWLTDRRAAVYLKPEGTYTLLYHDDPADLKVFLAALTITHAKGALK